MKFPNNIQSKCYYHVAIRADNIKSARSLVMTLLLSPYDTINGIVVSVDIPYGTPIMNISRPAVLRTYYGLDLKPMSSTTTERVTYGPISLTGWLSMDPRQYPTKHMSTHMFEFDLCLKDSAKSNLKSSIKTVAYLTVTLIAAPS